MKGRDEGRGSREGEISTSRKCHSEHFQILQFSDLGCARTLGPAVAAPMALRYRAVLFSPSRIAQAILSGC